MLKVSLSVWRDEAHGHLDRSNAPEDDEEIEDGDDVNNSRVVEHSNPNLPSPSSFQVSSTEPSRANADTESNSRETEAENIQGIDFGGDDEASWRSPKSITGDASQKVSTNGISATNSSMDQDQEMWDIVNEFENEGQTPSAVAPMTQPTIPEPPDSGDDWEDMYL
jgi:replication fork protection complex subunit Csm3/Swi3